MSNFTIDGLAFPIQTGGGGTCDYPDAADVALGVTYADGTMVGTLACGHGVPYDPETVFLHSPAQVLQHLFITLGLGSNIADNLPWPILATAEVDTPDNSIVVYDTTGLSKSRVQESGRQIERFGFQLLIRSARHPTGYAKSHYLAKTIDEGVYNNAVRITDADGDATYLVESMDRKPGPPNSLGMASSGGKTKLFTLNGTVIINRIA